MLIGALVTVGLRAFSDPKVALVYGAIVLGIAVLRSSYGALRTRNPRFLLFAAYGFIHVLLLIPARLHAIATLGRTHWGTRGMSRAAAPSDVEPATVLQARPAVRPPMPMPIQRTHASTVMTVEDTRAARTTVEPGAAPVVRDVLPALERGFNGRWRPVRSAASTVVLVPRQRAMSAEADIDWTLWSTEVAAV
jgi:hypothetical protein